MNITSSPDPTPMPARSDRSAAGSISAKDCGTTPFADMLGASAEHLPDESRDPADGKPQPRKQSADGADPALAILLPFMFPQAPLMPEPATPNGMMGPLAGGAPDATVLGTGESSGAVAPLQSAPLASHTAFLAPDAAPVSAISSAVGKAANMATDSSGVQPLQAGPAVAGAAAENALSAEQAVAAPVPAPVASEAGKGILQRQSLDASGSEYAEKAGGTAAAMQRLIMKEQSPERQTRTVASIAAIASALGKLRGAGTPEKSSGMRMSDSAVIIPAGAGVAFGPPAGMEQISEALAPHEPNAASEITRQTFDLIERIRVTGRDNAEVRMFLNDGQQVTVSLRLERGEWKPVFKTESEALCRALEQNWNRAVAQPASQSVKFGSPVFESQSAQSDLGRNSQQQAESGGRERSFNRREQEPAFENAAPSRAGAKPARTSQASRFSEAAAMQVYA